MNTPAPPPMWEPVPGQIDLVELLASDDAAQAPQHQHSPDTGAQRADTK